MAANNLYFPQLSRTFSIVPENYIAIDNKQTGLPFKITIEDFASELKRLDLITFDGSGYVTSVTSTNGGVDNTDPQNPILTFPTNVTDLNNDAGFITDTSYIDLTDTTDTTYLGKQYYVPQVNSAETGLELIALGAVAFSNDYNDLINKPVISDTNFANTDLTFTVNRTHNLATQRLTFTNPEVVHFSESASSIFAFGANTWDTFSMVDITNTLKNKALRVVNEYVGTADTSAIVASANSSSGIGVTAQGLRTGFYSYVSGSQLRGYETQINTDNARGLYVNLQNGNGNRNIYSTTLGTDNYSGYFESSGSANFYIKDGRTSLEISNNVGNTVGGSDTRYGVRNYVFSSGATAYGIFGSYNEVSIPSGASGAIVGVFGKAFGSTVQNVGIKGEAPITTGSADNIGIWGIAGASTGGGRYAARLQDGTESVNQALLCVTANGDSNWGKITSDYTTGATGSFTTVDGKTVTVTDGLITNIV